MFITFLITDLGVSKLKKFAKESEGKETHSAPQATASPGTPGSGDRSLTFATTPKSLQSSQLSSVSQVIKRLHQMFLGSNSMWNCFLCRVMHIHVELQMKV